MAYGKHVWLVVALGCSACVIDQGPGEALANDPRDQEPQPAGTSARAGATAGAAGRANEGRSGAGVAEGGTGSTAAGVHAAGAGGAGARSGTTGGGGAGRAGDRDASVAPDSGADDDSGSECGLQVAVCNPVTNEGCPDALGMHCAVDPLATLTGYCIFSTAPTPGPTGGECLNTGVTESCPPTSTCYEDECRELCFCDGDCEPGLCCTERLESTGFKVCGEC